MTNLFITIIARIRTRKGPAIPCEMHLSTQTLKSEWSISTSEYIIGCALYEKAGGCPDYQELGDRIHNDTGLDVTIAAIKVIEQPEEEEEETMAKRSPSRQRRAERRARERQRQKLERIERRTPRS